ncbi:unnamed protein product [Penicillium olsonii]|nr:unnamed protein product [Penicillium olsonii]
MPVQRYSTCSRCVNCGHIQTGSSCLLLSDILTAFGGEFQPGMHVPVEKKGLANPAPLGLCAFAFTNFVMSLISLNTRGLSFPNVIIGPALAYAASCSLFLACAGNTFGATAFSSFGAYWIAYAIIIAPNGLGIEESIKETAGALGFLTSMGFFMMGFFIFTTVMLLCTLRSSVAFFILVFCVDIAYLMLGLAYLFPQNNAANESLVRAGGVFSLASAFLAWYNAIAGLADGSNSFFVVPVVHFPWSDKGIRDRRREKVALTHA